MWHSCQNVTKTNTSTYVMIVCVCVCVCVGFGVPVLLCVCVGRCAFVLCHVLVIIMIIIQVINGDVSDVHKASFEGVIAVFVLAVAVVVAVGLNVCT